MPTTARRHFLYVSYDSFSCFVYYDNNVTFLDLITWFRVNFCYNTLFLGTDGRHRTCQRIHLYEDITFLDSLTD